MLRSLKAAFVSAVSMPFLMAPAAAQEQSQVPAPAVATPAPAPAVPPRFTDPGVVSYWKPGTMDVVLRIWPCESQGACGDIYWYNPRDNDVHENFGNPRNRNENLCGYSPRMSFNASSDTRWEGTMYVRGRGITANVTVGIPSQTQIDFKATWGFFERKDIWRRVEPNDPRFPACTR